MFARAKLPKICVRTHILMRFLYKKDYFLIFYSRTRLNFLFLAIIESFLPDLVTRRGRIAGYVTDERDKSRQKRLD